MASHNKKYQRDFCTIVHQKTIDGFMEQNYKFRYSQFHIKGIFGGPIKSVTKILGGYLTYIHDILTYLFFS